MSDEAANVSASRMRHRPLRVPVDEVARHSVSDDDAPPLASDETTAVDLEAAPAEVAVDAAALAKKPQRSSVVAMKSVIVTSATSRALSKPPPPPSSAGDGAEPLPLSAVKVPPAARLPADAEDSGEVELTVEAADASASAEISAAQEADFDDEVSAEITIEGIAEGGADDDVLDMDDLEEVAPSTPPAAAPAIPAPNGAAAAPGAASTVQTGPNAPPQAPGTPKRKPWFDDFFSDDYLRTVRAPTPKEVARECDAILAMLKLDPGAIILDVGCGLGMHAVELTLRGYIVIGLDLSLPMLSRAADEAQDRGIKINFLHADMREMVFEGGFDAVLCWGTTFGYFDDEGNRSVIERFYSALKPGGRLLIDVVNRDHVIQSQPNLVWFEGDGCICMEETDFNYYASRLNVKRNVILDNGRQHDRHYSIRLYALHELGQLLQTQGFRVVEVTGRYATPGVFFGAQSPRMIVLAERRLSARDTPPPTLPSVPPPPPPGAAASSTSAASAPSDGSPKTPDDTTQPTDASNEDPA